MREKLIELIRKADKEDYESRTQDEHYAFMADLLIANGVTIPVKCKECRFYKDDGEYCGFWGECRHPEHFCDEGVSDNEKL